MFTRTIFIFTVLCCLSACGGSGGSKSKTTNTLAPIELPSAPDSQFISFESAPVRPIAILDRVLALTNTPNHSVELFRLDDDNRPVHSHTVPVGLEPVALAFVNADELWVVNHLSDSVSIVDLSQSSPVVTRTILVGDEPQDIVFGQGKVFVSAAHRGQHLNHSSLDGVEGAGDPQLHQAGVGRADVWVFDPNNLGDTLGGTPVKILNFFGDSPRGLALSPDEKTLYVGVFHSGNQTTAVHEAVMCQGYEDDEFGQYPCQVMDGITSPAGLDEGWLPGGRTAPGTNADGEYQPWTSMIVQYDSASGEWRDSKGRNFSNGVRFNLPDLDVFAVNTNSLIEENAFAHVGTTLFNLATHPANGQLFVSNTDANNATRFEGAGDYASSTVQGNIAKTRITVIDPKNAEVRPRHLNRHIDYTQLKASPSVSHHSLSTPTQIAFTRTGDQAYMTAMGSNKIAVLNSQQLIDNRFWDNTDEEFDPETASQFYLDVSGGPVGLALSKDDKTLFAYTRYDNALVTIDRNTGAELQRLTLFSPEPTDFQAGRPMLYDANRSSSNGESSCASCHIFADTDHLSWNLGNPDAPNTRNPQPFPTANLSRLGCDLVGPDDPSCQLLELINGNGDELSIASMKGPMGTQTLRGMSTHGHMHWRGDRVNGYFGDDLAQTLDERQSFKNFIVAFEGLLGLDIELPTNASASEKSPEVEQLERDMDKFADFMLAVALPPNPIRNLDNSLNQSARLGEAFFHGTRRSDGSAIDVNFNGPEADGVNCEGCHGVDHAEGFYGTRGEIAHGGEIQIFKVPQLRNLYTRVGMFGLPDREGFLPSHTKTHQGDQIRGFGFLHDGATDQLVNFLRGGVFDNGEDGCPQGISSAHGCEFNEGFVGIPDEETRQGLVDYLMAFDNDLAPIVGQQISLNAKTAPYVQDRLALLHNRAQSDFVSKILGGQTKECDLIAQGSISGQARAFLFLPEHKRFVSDQREGPQYSAAQLQSLATQGSNTLTYTCVVPGQGWRMALDHNNDQIFNGDD